MATVRTPGKSEIESAYAVKVRHVKACASVYRPDAALHIVTESGGALLLKPVRLPHHDILRFHERLKRLIQSGYSDAPDLIPGRNGELITQLDGDAYYAVDWIDGHMLDCLPAQAAALGRCLARLHQADCDSPARRGGLLAPLEHWSDKVLRAHTRISRLQSQSSLAAVWFQKHATECKQLSSQALAILRVPRVKEAFAGGYQSPCWVHGDVTAPNAIVTSDGTVRLIDWELLHAGHPLFELTKSLSNTAGFQPAMMLALLDGYTDVRPLAQAEKDVVRAWFRFPREAWDISRNALQGSTPDGFDILKRTWSARRRAIRTLDRWAKGTR